MDEVLDEILEEIQPDTEEIKDLKETCEHVKNVAKELSENYDFEPLFCGSIAKDTWLSSKKDIDLFLLFDEELDMEEFEEKGMEAAKLIINKLNGKWSIAYAEHPYVRGEVRGYEIDIVPAYDVEPDSIKSSVDRTPWHVRWVENNITHDQCDQVRLLKKFCKEHGLYGSNLRVRGFSGYLCEILIAEYGSFENLAEEAAEWNAGKVIDPEDYFKSEGYLKREKFEGAPLIVIDPVDKDRNVASVLSAEKLFLFKKAIKEFIDSPGRETFFTEETQPLDLKELRNRIEERGTDFLLLEFEAPDVHQDVLFPQMRKLNERIRKVLDEEGFVVLRQDEWSDEETCVLIQELEVDELPRIDKRRGPPIFDARNSKKFIQRYEGKHNLLIQDNKWYAEYFRDNTRALDFVREFLDGNSEGLQEKGVPKHLAEKIDESLKIATSHHSYQIFRKHEGLRKKMRKYFEKDLA